MASFKAQMEVHEASRMATSALESASKASVERVFVSWEYEQISGKDVRWELERVLREAYRTSAAVARGVAEETSDLPGWSPEVVGNTEYLQALLEDVRANLRAYKRGERSREATVARIQHSVGVAAQRGYTDQIVSAYTELEQFGLAVRKYWVANFVDNDPCPSCRRLHGTHVGLNESFPTEFGESGVYRDLLGPPRHPRCKCRLYIFRITLENAFQSPNFETPQDAPEMMTTADVKKLPKSILAAIKASLRAILKFLRGRR